MQYRNKIISVGAVYLPNKNGIVENITPLKELLKMDGVINGYMFAKLGELQKKRRVGNDASGWIQVMGIDENNTLKKLQKIYDSFVIETQEKGRGLVYVKKN